jgi:RHS repeat-associated protein
MRFYYDGDRVVEERTGGANTPSKQYVWGNYVDELLINDTVDAFGNVVLVSRLYALQNSTYSVHALVNDAGLVVERYSYTSYGEVTFLSPGGAPLLDPATGLPRTSSAVGNVYTFTGREIDAETGLLHFRARSYAPKLGRFLQRDPAGFADGMNLYEFGTSRATVATDPTGNWIANHVVQILRDQGYAAAVTPRNEISVPLLVPNSRDWFDLEYVVVKKHHNWLWNWWHDWNDVREGRPLWIWHDADNYAAAGYIIAAAKDVQAKLVHQRRSVQDIRRIREIATQHPLGWGGWVLEKELMIVGAVANPGVAAAGAGIGGTADVLVQGAENLDDWRAGRQLRGYDPKRTAFVATHSAGVAGGTASLPARAQHGVIGIAVVGLGADVYGDYRSGNAVTGTTKIAITGLVLLGARSAQKRAETAETRAMAEHIGMLRASNLARRPPAPVETVLFRGTSQGFEGSPTLQRYHVTPTTPNPAVATVFATEAANHGHGVVHIVPPSRLAGARTTTPNVLAQLEREVAVEMRPTTFASRAELTISAPDARAILARMGIPIPPRIATGQISTLLREIPDMSPAQVAEFIRLAREVAKGG